MARQFSFVIAFAAVISLACSASAEVAASPSQARDGKAVHETAKMAAPADKTASSSDGEDRAGAKPAHAALSSRHRGELNGNLHLGDW